MTEQEINDLATDSDRARAALTIALEALELIEKDIMYSAAEAAEALQAIRKVLEQS